jgi:hypothetical protein
MRLKGKQPIFNTRDTLSLDCTLDPIIAEGLKKFKEVIKTAEFAGYPIEFELDNDDEAFENWLATIDKMIYAFDANEPEIPETNYLEMVSSDEPDENGYFPVEINVLDQEVYNKHEADDKEHRKKVQEGLDLFAKYYKALWW